MKEDHRRVALELVRAALDAADPEQAVHRHLRRERDTLWAGASTYDLSQVGRVVVVGGGKAAPAMARAAAEVLGETLHRGLVITKTGHARGPLPRGIEVHEASHPLPDHAGVKSTGQMLELLEDLREDDLVLCLLSGGGSALLTAPVDGVSLAQLEQLNHLLLGAGAPIEQINTVRKHLSSIKGGRLLSRAAPARVVSLILSDVVESPLDVIASGPTAADPSTYGDALEVLGRHGLLARTPAPILQHLRQGADGRWPETLAPGDPLLERVDNCIVGSNLQAAEAATARARELGLDSLVLSTSMQGEAREVGRVYAAILKEMAHHQRPLVRPACVVAGGETTVTLRGGGQGGRNQELALSAALDIEGLEHVLLVALATDGTDGPTDAGGALCDGTTAARARAMGLDPRVHLNQNDAYPLFAALDDLLLLGPTGTNVNDLTFLLAF